MKKEPPVSTGGIKIKVSQEKHFYIHSKLVTNYFFFLHFIQKGLERCTLFFDLQCIKLLKQIHNSEECDRTKQRGITHATSNLGKELNL